MIPPSRFPSEPATGPSSPGASPKASPAAGREGRPPRGRFAALFLDRFDRVSLSAKLVACTLVVLIVGTIGISASIRQLVSSYLLDKTDRQIASQSDMVLSSSLLLNGSELSNNGLNTYFLQVRYMQDGKLTGRIDTRLYPVLENDVVSIPDLPANADLTDDDLTHPFTTSANVTTVARMNAEAGGSATPDQASGAPASPSVVSAAPSRTILKQANAPWRVAAFQWPNSDGGVRAVVFIGLSLADQIDIVDTLTKYCIVVGIAIVLLGGSLAALIIQRTLDPLKRIEKTAAKIAAGDLAQRVPWAPENTEIGSLAVSLNAMLARIEKSFHEQEQTTAKMKRFVSDASHELRTPLAAIHGYAELYAMQRDMPGALERADESIAHIERSSQRMTVLVEDLLSLARLDEGRGIDMTQSVALTGVVADALDDLHALDPEREVTRGTVVFSPSADLGHPASLAIEDGAMTPVTLTGDASRLRQVVTNIVGNIHRYTPADSPARVGVGVMPASIAPDMLARMPATDESMLRFLDAAEVGRSMRTGTNYAVLRFEDHGPGVPEESRAQIFERFYTADPSRAREKGGTGLGLAIAQSVVKAHHGFICATPTEGGGLTFTIILPVGPVERPSAADAVRSDAPDAGKARAGATGRDKDKAKRSSWFSR